MKVKILGNNLTSDNFKSVIDKLNEDYKDLGVRVKNATCYIRFITEDDETVDVTDGRYEIERSFKFTKKIDVSKNKKGKKTKEAVK